MNTIQHLLQKILLTNRELSCLNRKTSIFLKHLSYYSTMNCNFGGQQHHLLSNSHSNTEKFMISGHQRKQTLLTHWMLVFPISYE